MIRRFFNRAPLTFGWVACGLCAFLGARFSADQAVTGAVWSGGAFVILGVSVGVWWRVHNRRRHYRADCEFREWAQHTLLVVRDKDDQTWSFTVAELRNAGDLLWDIPTAAALYNAEWLVKKTEEGPTHGKPA